jgi:hypothetical protein
MLFRVFVVALFTGGRMAAFADAPKEKNEEDPAVLVDAAGKEHKLTNVKFVAGIRRLAFLADRKGTTDDERKGPLALEVREPSSTTFQKGVVTLVPLASVESVKYDYPNLAMSVGVKGQPELTGTLHFRGINVLSIEAKDGGTTTKFSGGVPKEGFKSIAFPAARSMATRSAGAAWSIQIVQPAAKDPTIIVRNVKALYAFPGGVEQRVEAIPVRKGEPLRFDSKLKKLEMIAVDQNTRMAVMEVETEGGPERLVAAPLTLEQQQRTGILIGLIGEVDHGWKLFPLHAVKVVKPAG